MNRRRGWLLGGGLALWAMGAQAFGPAAPAPSLADCQAEGFQTVLQALPSPSAALQATPAAQEARAVWLTEGLIQWPGAQAGQGRFRLYAAAGAALVAEPGQAVRGASAAFPLSPSVRPPAADVAQRFRYLSAGVQLAMPHVPRAQLVGLHRGQTLLVHEDREGRVLQATRLQAAAALDGLYAAAQRLSDLGVTVSRKTTRFRLWAPTAQRVAVCLFPNGRAAAQALLPLRFDAASGSWWGGVPGDRSGQSYTYLVDVFVPGVGLVRNRVTDPYSVSLSTDSRRSYVADLAVPALKPPGWDRTAAPRIGAPTDMVIYELHVRDFSMQDTSVPQPHRGKYLAFAHAGSDGMRHLKALAEAGLTDVHLLPVFDFATVPEQGCVTPRPEGPPDGEQQQAAVAAVKDRDCFNWGYDPLHYTAPEGSYATDAEDGARRILEFRRMVQALHRAGLRVGMDVVYNHTSASGQHEKSVLDRIVPGYYHRLDAAGRVERSTCCDNTATEHRMMAKLMLDSVLTWAREYKIDSFRFDLMGHQPRAVMEQLQQRLRTQLRREIPLIGEGWNFGEVADGARFVQASQRSLNGSGIGTFSDRARDAVRGGGPADGGNKLFELQGYINGLHHDPNGHAEQPREALLHAADLVRVGLAGTLRSYPLHTWRGDTLPLERIDYNGQPAGYASQPAEVVNYVENHDNHTLFDLNALKLPRGTSAHDRARVQILGAATTAFSQGIAYFHAGIDVLRSKSMDRNSYDSGDWFNRLDWRYQVNFFGTGLPPAQDNAEAWPVVKPLLADERIKPAPADIAWTRDAFRDLLKIRASSTLFRLRTADEVRRRLRFFNTGPAQVPTVIAAHLDGRGHPGARFGDVVMLINVDTRPQTVSDPALQHRGLRLHPVHTAPSAADQRAADARYDAAAGAFSVPPRTAVVFVTP